MFFSNLGITFLIKQVTNPELVSKRRMTHQIIKTQPEPKKSIKTQNLVMVHTKNDVAFMQKLKNKFVRWGKKKCKKEKVKNLGRSLER